MPQVEISKAIMDVYNDLKIWKGDCDDDLTSMEDGSWQGQIQPTAIRLWWNHAIILLLSTEEQDPIMEGVAKDSMFLMDDMNSAVRSFFRYEQYLMDWPFHRFPLLSLLGLK